MEGSPWRPAGDQRLSGLHLAPPPFFMICSAGTQNTSPSTGDTRFRELPEFTQLDVAEWDVDVFFLEYDRL